MTFVVLLFSVMAVGCEEDDMSGESIRGLSVKALVPSSVMAGMEIQVMGTGLDRVTEVVLPGGVSITDFEAVTSNLLLVKVPAGIKDGTVTIVAGGEAVDSPLPLRLAHPQVTSMVPGDEATESQEITFMVPRGKTWLWMPWISCAKVRAI